MLKTEFYKRIAKFMREMDNALTNELLNSTIQLENESLIYFKSLGLKKLSKKAFPVLTLTDVLCLLKMM